MSNSRKYFKKSGKAIKQQKVVGRYRMMYDKFTAMSVAELDAIKNDKRSKTDEFAYKTAYIGVVKKSKEELVNPVAD